ncbi:promotilin isoform X2 [Panthera tigris]|nr:promotilin isoform X2 [Panthera tigris]
METFPLHELWKLWKTSPVTTRVAGVWDASPQLCDGGRTASPRHLFTSLGQRRASELLCPRMVSRKAVAVLLMVHVAVMLASQTEAFVPIFTHSELQRIREKERNKGQKKSLIVQQRSEEVGPLDPVEPTEEEENEVIKLTAPVAIGTRMNSRQLEKYRAALEGLLSEVLLPARNDK